MEAKGIEIFHSYKINIKKTFYVYYNKKRRKSNKCTFDNQILRVQNREMEFYNKTS